MSAKFQPSSYTSLLLDFLLASEKMVPLHFPPHTSCCFCCRGKGTNDLYTYSAARQNGVSGRHLDRIFNLTLATAVTKRSFMLDAIKNRLRIKYIMCDKKNYRKESVKNGCKKLICWKNKFRKVKLKEINSERNFGKTESNCS